MKSYTPNNTNFRQYFIPLFVRTLFYSFLLLLLFLFTFFYFQFYFGCHYKQLKTFVPKRTWCALSFDELNYWKKGSNENEKKNRENDKCNVFGWVNIFNKSQLKEIRHIYITLCLYNMVDAEKKRKNLHYLKIVAELFLHTKSTRKKTIKDTCRI